MDTYLTISNQPTSIYKDKGSKFIALAYHVTTIEEIKDIITMIKKEYFDARHVCYAYTLGFERNTYRANDDGEPSSTAGKPILGQINSAQLTDILIVVVRYFGGTLLGTSGLIQAYKTSAAEVIKLANIEEKVVEKQFCVEFGYDMQDAVMRVIKDFNISILQLNQELSCRVLLGIRLDNIQQVSDRFSKLLNIRFYDK